MARHIAIDRLGRLVIPRDVRARLGLRAGSRLRLAQDGVGIVLTPEDVEAPLREQDGLLIYTGPLPDEVPDHRRERDARLAGLGRP